jgi:hypothetical protein
MKVVRLSALRTIRLYPRKYYWYSFLLEATSTGGPQCSRKDHVNRKISATPSGIEPATFRFVATACPNCLLSWFHTPIWFLIMNFFQRHYSGKMNFRHTSFRLCVWIINTYFKLCAQESIIVAQAKHFGKRLLVFHLSPSVSPPYVFSHGTTQFLLEKSSWNFISRIFTKMSDKMPVTLIEDIDNRHIDWRHILILSHFATYETT